MLSNPCYNSSFSSTCMAPGRRLVNFCLPNLGSMACREKSINIDSPLEKKEKEMSNFPKVTDAFHNRKLSKLQEVELRPKNE